MGFKSVWMIFRLINDLISELTDEEVAMIRTMLYLRPGGQLVTKLYKLDEANRLLLLDEIYAVITAAADDNSSLLSDIQSTIDDYEEV